MSVKPKAIIVDLDGTLCNVDHREHFMQQTPKKRDEFHSACVDDPIDETVRDLVDMYASNGYSVIILTARPSRYVAETKTWLSQYDVRYDALFMGDGVNDPDPVFKKRIYETYIKPIYDVKLTLEDRKSVVDMWRSLGMKCLDVAGNTF